MTSEEALERISPENSVTVQVGHESPDTQPRICFVEGNNTLRQAFKITLQPHSLTYSGNDCKCPVVFCRKKIPKNRSIEEHINCHLNPIYQEVVAIPKDDKYDVHYHCPDVTCKYSDVKDLGHFLKLKYLKQHYLKMHAPKLLSCPNCQKTFATLSYLQSHQVMCGITFTCSCNVSYPTLEALQTHARRKKHDFDVAKYKEILSSEKVKLKQQPGISCESSASCNDTEDVESAKERMTKPYPILLPKSNPSNVLEVLDIFGRPEIPPSKTTIDFGTQTVAHQHTNLLSSSSTGFHLGSTGRKLSIDASETRTPKRKKSAETQTARVRVRVSTETQTTNVIKRRRSTRKQQSAEAQTQCQQDVNQKVTSTKVDSYQQMDIDPILKDDSIATPISEFEGDSFFREMEEVHIQTQTEPDLFLGGDNVFADYNVHVNMSDSDVSSFLNFVSAETQTVLPSQSTSWNTNYVESCNNKTEPDLLNSSLPATEDPVQGNLRSVNIGYLETMDNETQTQFYDFVTIFSKMFD